MDVTVELLDAAFALLLLSWAFVEVFRQSKNEDACELQAAQRFARRSSTSWKISVLASTVMSLSYLSYGIYEYVKNQKKHFTYETFFPFSTWLVATFVAVYSNGESDRSQRRWPVILILWWIFASTWNFLTTFIYFITLWSAIELPHHVPQPKLSDVASCPLTLLLCVNLLINGTQLRAEATLYEPLLQKEDESSFSGSHSFSEAGVWSKLSFQWLNPLFRRGQEGKLELYDIPTIPRSEAAIYASSLLEESLGKQKGAVLNLPRAIAQAVWKPVAINGVFAGVSAIASYVGPFLITNLVNFLSGKSENSHQIYGLVLASIFFVSKTVESLIQRQWYFGAQRIGIRVRAALMVHIYKKSLSSNSAPSNGRIVNLINVDVERIGDFFWSIHGVWLLPFQVFLGLVILHKNLGAVPSLAALLSTILIMVSNTPLASKQQKFHSKIMENRDIRIKATFEALKSMRVLKLYSWETTFMNKLFQLRETESHWLSRYLYTNSATVFLFWASPTLVSVITFSVCILLKTPLTTGSVLSALATFRILQEPIYNLPELISMVTQTKISLDRVREFLREEDQKKQIFYRCSKVPNVAVDLEAGAYAWETDDQMQKKPTVKLTDKIQIMLGYKVAVCGPVGCGKSSLLSSMLGEITRVSGVGIKIYGTKAYVPQSAWIQTGTVRENILFGKRMNESFYDEVLQGCALNQDIMLWENGDMTLVGERGLNMSGGQKQRIQLARAVYSASDVYILDDPFSAVDAHTGRHLFKKCVMKLLANKTVIYATHQLDFLEEADLILVMKDGVIVQSGKYEKLISDVDGEFVRQMAAHSKSMSQVQTPTGQHLARRRNQSVCTKVIDEIVKEPNHDRSLQRQEDDTEAGRVKWSIYTAFITAAYGGALVPVILLCQVLFQGLQMASNYWIAWASEEEHGISNQILLGIFILLSGGGSVFILARALVLASIAIKTAQSLYLRMITSVFRAPIQFFDSTPTSKILHRSSTDQSTLDTDIPYRLAGLAFALIQLLSIIFLMSLVAWQLLLLFMIIIGISLWYQAYYLTTARELARMVGVRKSPILHHFSETIAGASIIRGFNQEDRFTIKNMYLIDDYSCVVFNNIGTMEWLSVRINFFFNVGFFLVLIILVNLPTDAMDSSLSGLVATYGLNLNVLQSWVIWNVCNVENKMISVERILRLTSIRSEAPLVVKECRPDPKWPSNGTVELIDLSVQHNPSLPMVLKSLNCTIPGGKKTGIVGRTGSGKSTLIQALFRVVEATQGKIIIDEMDISKLGLQDLRSRLAIIPQDPTLFQGSVRLNLDPLGEHTDHDIWQVLRKCRLVDLVQKDQRLLDAPVAEDGTNWSVGQRQLVCLARVLLKRRKILVLDEATASMDTLTDNIIQQTIRQETIGCTLITVAHRIPSVIDNDMVMVLDEGKILEYESPQKLLESDSSSFAKLVTEYLRRSSSSATKHRR